MDPETHHFLEERNYLSSPSCTGQAASDVNFQHRTAMAEAGCRCCRLLPFWVSENWGCPTLPHKRARLIGKVMILTITVWEYHRSGHTHLLERVGLLNYHSCMCWLLF